MPTTHRFNCSNCRHSWFMGRNTGTLTARCGNEMSPKYRRCLHIGATCPSWEAKEGGDL